MGSSERMSRASLALAAAAIRLRSGGGKKVGGGAGCSAVSADLSDVEASASLLVEHTLKEEEAGDSTSE